MEGAVRQINRAVAAVLKIIAVRDGISPVCDPVFSLKSFGPEDGVHDVKMTVEKIIVYNLTVAFLIKGLI
jgi:hypothetical protein